MRAAIQLHSLGFVIGRHLAGRNEPSPAVCSQLRMLGAGSEGPVDLLLVGSHVSTQRLADRARVERDVNSVISVGTVRTLTRLTLEQTHVAANTVSGAASPLGSACTASQLNVGHSRRQMWGKERR